MSTAHGEVPVVFRKDSDGTVFALFPTLPADNSGRYCTTYQHVGQHSSADYFGCIGRSKPATAEEFKSLERELTGRGYTLRIIKSAQRCHHDARFAALREMAKVEPDRAKLHSETDTPEIEADILAAFNASELSAASFWAVFEHGQWWVNSGTGGQWSVCDASGKGSFDGYGFELITAEDES